VAREAGVSTATVSRVVHGLDGVRPSTRRRVLEVVEALGFVPDSAAQSMVRGRKEVVGLVAIASRGPDTDIEQEGLLFIEEVLRGVESTLSPLGWPVLVSVRRSPDDTGAYPWLQKMSAKVDGLLIAEGIDEEHMTRLASRIPIVLISGSPDQPKADVVHADNGAGIKAVVRHLIERHGRSRLFYVGGPAEAPDARERRAAFDEELARHPGTRLAGSFEGWFVATSGQQAVREILAAGRLGGRGGEVPDAIVCANDQMAIGAMRELQAAGLRVPADVAVTGFDDIHLGALFAPPLTTVHQPMRLLGARACGLVLDRIADPTLPRRVELLPTELIVRESCGCPAAALRRLSGLKTQEAGGRRVREDDGQRGAVRVPVRLGPGLPREEHPRGHESTAQVRQRQCHRGGVRVAVLAATPDREVAAAWRAQAERDPGIVPARQAKRPERD
jgi:LacI family transcriptional regulator